MIKLATGIRYPCQQGGQCGEYRQYLMRGAVVVACCVQQQNLASSMVEYVPTCAYQWRGGQIELLYDLLWMTALYQLLL